MNFYTGAIRKSMDTIYVLLMFVLTVITVREVYGGIVYTVQHVQCCNVEVQMQ